MGKGPEILEKARTAPDTLDTKERLAFGTAVIQTAMTDETIGLKEREELLQHAFNITRQALTKIRTDDQFSEQERFRAASLVLSRVEWKEAESTREGVELSLETMLTLASGLETPIREKLVQGWQDIIQSNYEASATLMLLDIPTDSSLSNKFVIFKKKIV